MSLKTPQRRGLLRRSAQPVQVVESNTPRRSLFDTPNVPAACLTSRRARSRIPLPDNTMTRKSLLILFVALWFPILASAQTADATAPAPPSTRRADVQETLNGVTIADPSRWPETQAPAQHRA